MRQIFWIIIFLLPAICFSDKLIVGGLSYHHQSLSYIPNEKHAAIGLERGNWQYGIYNNSVEKASVFIGYIDRPWQISENFSAGYSFGLASGYGDFTMERKDKLVIDCDRIPNGWRCFDVRLQTIDVDGYKYGIMPQAQFLVSHESKYITVDLGVSVVSTLAFKINL